MMKVVEMLVVGIGEKIGRGGVDEGGGESEGDGCEWAVLSVE